MLKVEKENCKGKYPEMVELKRFLHKKNITYRELSEMIGISLDAANNKLNGYTDFNKHEMITIYKAFGLTVWINACSVHKGVWYRDITNGVKIL